MNYIIRNHFNFNVMIKMGSNEIQDLENEIAQLNIIIEKKKLKLLELRSEKSPAHQEKLTNDEICRYSRQIILPEIGVKGQIQLRNAKVLIVGAGGLGKKYSIDLD